MQRGDYFAIAKDDWARCQSWSNRAKLFAWQCGEVIATGSEMLSLSHCAVPFLFRALSDWASECFPIEIIMRLNWDCCI